jgi:hypothetical protein
VRETRHQEGLVEQQGVNAGGPVDEEPGPHDAPAAPAPPGTTGPPSAELPEEMVGVPTQRPGLPGQQRSVDTS